MLNRKTKLLIVDDDVLLRTSLAELFTEFGHSVRSAEDGFSALAAIEIEIPDILLSDLHMPGMSGFELLPKIRRQFPSVRVIAMSSAFSGNSVPLGLPADAFHAKGANIAQLVRLIEALRPSLGGQPWPGSDTRRTA